MDWAELGKKGKSYCNHPSSSFTSQTRLRKGTSTTSPSPFSLQYAIGLATVHTKVLQLTTKVVTGKRCCDSISVHKLRNLNSHTTAYAINVHVTARTLRLPGWEPVRCSFIYISSAIRGNPGRFQGENTCNGCGTCRAISAASESGASKKLGSDAPGRSSMTRPIIDICSGICSFLAAVDLDRLLLE